MANRIPSIGKDASYGYLSSAGQVQQSQTAATHAYTNINGLVSFELKCTAPDCNVISIVANPNFRQFQIRRFPAKRSDIPPWLSLTSNPSFSEYILSLSPKLRHTALYGKVYIMHDLSPSEREIKNLLVNQLRERRIAEPNKSFCIRNNRVIQLSNSTSSNNCSVITLNKDKVTQVQRQHLYLIQTLRYCGVTIGILEIQILPYDWIGVLSNIKQASILLYLFPHCQYCLD
ncbi:hypothetical protein GJ496_001040 [Pomphorhynchus laevis]|nr:hypothetical protein GJ496_001040 [Pomphorhynchus laevis]